MLHEYLPFSYFSNSLLCSLLTRHSLLHAYFPFPYCSNSLLRSLLTDTPCCMNIFHFLLIVLIHSSVLYLQTLLAACIFSISIFSNSLLRSLLTETPFYLLLYLVFTERNSDWVIALIIIDQTQGAV